MAAGANANSGDWILGLTFEHGPIIAHDNPGEGRRLITVITAKKPDGTVFWRSAFYKSTGRNSTIPGVWFPFLGISRRLTQKINMFGKLSESKGDPMYTKSMGLPSKWPKPDIITSIQVDSWPPDDYKKYRREFEDRMLAKSFMLASNFMEPLGLDKANLDENIDGMRHALIMDPILEAILTKLSENNEFNKYADLYDPEKLPGSSYIEINKIIGDGLYFNEYMDSSVNLRNYGDNLPNYINLASRFNYAFKQGGSMSIVARKSRKSRKTRKSRKSRKSRKTRKGQ